MRRRQLVAAHFQVQVCEVIVGVHHARVDAGGFQVCLDRKVRLPHVLVYKAEVVIAFAAVRIKLDAPPQSFDRFFVFFQAVINRSEVDVRAGPQRVQAGHFFEMVSGAVQIVEQETGRGQAVVYVGSIRTEGQRLQVNLACLLDLPLRDRLTSPLAEAFDAFGHHEIGSAVALVERAIPNGVCSQKDYTPHDGGVSTTNAVSDPGAWRIGSRLGPRCSDRLTFEIRRKKFQENA